MKKYAVILNEVSIEFPMSFDVRPSVRSQAGFFVKNKLLNKNKNKPQEIQAQNSQIGDNSSRTESGIYLRDDHCDWGSSGMNEFTNEFGKDS